MYLYEIYDASDDSLHEEARMLEACQNSGDEDRYVLGSPRDVA